MEASETFLIFALLYLNEFLISINYCTDLDMSVISFVRVYGKSFLAAEIKI